MKTLIMFFALLFAPLPQSSIIMAPASVTVDEIVAYEVEEYLNETAPADTNIYAITSVQDGAGGLYVSLVGLDPDLPAPYNWSYENQSQIVWVGSLVKTAGIYSVYSPVSSLATGGGADVSFPWAIGTKMMFGPLGIHGGSENAVDWVGGDDLGAGVSGPEVFASASGTIISVCEDGTQMGVVIDGEYRFGYLHLEKNTDLVQGRQVTRGEYLGKLKYGSFNDDCGGASQASNHYHLHWTFQPADGHFQAESWILNYSGETWVRGNQTVKVNQWMTGGGGTVPEDPEDPDDDEGGIADTPRFFTYLITGFRSIVRWGLGFFPDTLATVKMNKLFSVSENAIREMLGLANILLVNDIIDLSPVIWLSFAVILFRLAMAIPLTILLILTLVKYLKVI